MGNRNVIIVLTALQEAKCIQVLNLSKNKLTCIAAKTIGSLITACSNKLRVLLIHYNRIMGKGGQEIAAGIKTATAL